MNQTPNRRIPILPRMRNNLQMNSPVDSITRQARLKAQVAEQSEEFACKNPISIARDHQGKKDSPQTFKRKKGSKTKAETVLIKSDNNSLDSIPNLSQHYNQLKMRFMQIKRRHALEKARLLNSIREKTLRVSDMRQEKERLEQEKNRMIDQIDQIRQKLEYARQRNYRIRCSYEEYQGLMNSEYMSSVLMSQQYQGGLDINTDSMTYQELLQLGERIGNVSKGLTEEEMAALEQKEYVATPDPDTCTICCEELQAGEQVNQFNCKHIFHCTCIRDWLSNQKTCPVCKQDVLQKPPDKNV